jgi:hypothetical protein
MLRGRATVALDQIVAKRRYKGGNIAKLPICDEAKKFCVMMLRAASPSERLSQEEEAILRGVTAKTMRKRSE